MSRKINVFACGGFGQNIMLAMVKRNFFPLLKDHCALYALDTSEANLRKYNQSDLKSMIKTHLVPEADGSGAFRGENIGGIVTMVTDLVNSGTIEDGICIVISSASGGTGAVIAAELMHQLATRGRSVFGMTLETDEDDTKVKNTLKTVKTLQHKASSGNKNLSTFWQNNRDGDGKTRKAQADQIFLENLENFIVIGHPEMGKLDSKDIEHFLNFPIKSTEPGEVRFITVRQRAADEEFEELAEVPLAILSLLRDDDIDPDVPRGVGYTTHGILPPDLDFTDKRAETQFLIHGSKVAKLANHLETTIKEYEKIQAQQAEKAAGNQIRSQIGQLDDSGQFV